MASENEKVSTKHIPHDIALFILSKLPIKFIKRFSCVCKSWINFLENPNFLTMFHNNNRHTYLLLYQVVDTITSEHHATLHIVRDDKFKNNVKLDWSPPFQEEDDGVCMLSYSVNGILCLYQQGFRDTIVLWNPASEEFKVIPPIPLEHLPYFTAMVSLHGFGYDAVRDDYKVIHRSCSFGGILANVPHRSVSVPLWAIYSVRSNSWKKLDFSMRSLGCWTVNQVEVYLDGGCHWWGESQIPKEKVLVSFNLTNETCFTTLIPLDNYEDYEFDVDVGYLAVLNGSIAFIWNYGLTTTCHIMILGELGVKESWTKLFTVGPLQCLHDSPVWMKGLFPIGVGKKGDLFFINEAGELVRFDLRTQLIEEIGYRPENFCFQMVIYKESLLPIGGINN